VRIVELASEAVPFAKTGGLADVTSALSRDLAARGHRVSLFLPLYREIRRAGVEIGPTGVRVRVPATGGGWEAEIRRAVHSDSGVDVYFVDVPSLFDREGLYGDAGGDHPDNAARFACFTRAALEAARRLGDGIDVVHCHDWQSALAPLFLGSGDAPKTVLTLHNLAYQGVFPREVVARAGVPAELAWSADCDSHGQVGFLCAGIRRADRLTTVSPTYAREILTPQYGFGLEGVISARPDTVIGILNGIDTSLWDPAADPYLPATYSRDDLSGKALCKRTLQAEFGLAATPELPVFGQVSRLVEQKGLALIEELGDELGELPAQFVFLGSGEHRFEAIVRELAERLPNVSARITFDERLAHLVEAGADFFLMPSRFEPCGLNQMISQRYGTVPLVHAVGGLADSVVHASEANLAIGMATGIAFRGFDASALRWALRFALELYERPAVLTGVRKAGMRADWSWEASGRRYERLFQALLETEREAIDAE